MLALLARYILRCLGWKIVGTPPASLDKAVVVIAPHTSAWDFFHFKLLSLTAKRFVRFAIKKEALFFPIGLPLRWMGAFPIDRKALPQDGRKGRINAIASFFKHEKKVFFAIAPEGTRKDTKRWKTGFHYIARQAQVPILLCYIDYAKKELGYGPLLYPTNEVSHDLAFVMDFYRTKQGRYTKSHIL